MRCIPLLIVLMSACAPPDVSTSEPEPLTEAQQNALRCDLNPILLTLSTNADRTLFKQGCHLFFEETFGGNGRTCGSCHMQTLGDGNPDNNNFDLSPEDVEAAFAANPTGPLFRSIDADDGVADFTRLRTLATPRIPLVLHANVTVDERDGFVSPDGRTVTVLRTTPTIENIALDNNIMTDGREGPDLPHQANSAVLTHNQPGREATTAERLAMAFYQKHQFSNLGIRAFAAGAPAPVPPPVPTFLTGSYWDSVRRGRAFFVDDGQAAVDATHRDLCATCHSGPDLNMTSNSNPVQPAGEFISNNFVSETNFMRPPATRLTEHTYHIVLDHPVVMPAGTILPIPPGTPLFPPGTPFTLRSSDPGRILTSGDPCTNVASCLIQTQAQGFPTTTSFFKTPTLWGAADSAPYFHDSSATTIADVMRVYRFLFDVTADGLNALGLNGEPFRFTDQDVIDIENYFDIGFQHQPVLLP